MSMKKYKPNWEETQAAMQDWWLCKNTKRPVVNIRGILDKPCEPLEDEPVYETPWQFRFDAQKRVTEQRNFMRRFAFLGESYPNLNMNLGPGSIALYIGCEPGLSMRTVWFNPCVRESFSSHPDVKFDENNVWWQRHLQVVKEAVALSNGEFLVNIPDLVESLDILSSMRGAQDLCISLLEEPEAVHKFVRQVDDLYFNYYDPMHELTKLQDGTAGFASFDIFCKGKTAKLQCDFSAMISPEMFEEFVVPSLEKLCSQLDTSLYHLDGVDALRHLPALCKVKNLNAIQWTPGAGKPDAGYEEWYPYYDMIREAGKGMWLAIDGSGAGRVGNGNANRAKALTRRYGPEGMYLHMPPMPVDDAKAFLQDLTVIKR